LDLYPDTIREEVEQAFKEGLDCESVCSYKDVQRTFAKGKERVLAELERNERYQLLTDAVSRMQWWACFDADEAPANPNPIPARHAERVLVVQPYRRESPKVGRNDLCPCGSGRKFKKCCGPV
jgi:uncharacterized protein YchJ